MPRLAARPFGADVYPALFADLTEAPGRVARFFPLAPADPEAWRRRAEEADLLWRGPEAAARRQGLTAALQAYHDRMGLHPAQAKSLAALAQPGALVVITGQQAGLLGGPLYTLFKALGAVVRAAEAGRALGRPVVPMFWIASDDHDWSEVSRADFPAPDGTPVHLRLPGSGDFRSAGHIPVPAEARRLVGQLLSLYPPSAAGEQVAADLLAGLTRPGKTTLADWFAWQLHRLLGVFGLLLFDPMQPALRALAAPVFAGAAPRAAAAGRAVEEAGRALGAAGYAPGLDLEPDHVHLFCYVAGHRVALHAQDGRIRTKDGQVDWTPAELAARATSDPTAFSPNVSLRPVVQDFTLPVLCQLGGPGEIAYLAQLGGVFALWDRPVPMVAPRPGATLLAPEDGRFLAGAGVELRDLRRDAQATLDQAAAAQCPVDLDGLFAAERDSVATRYAALGLALGAAAPTLSGVVGENAARVGRQLDYLERKAHQHLRRAQRVLISGLRGVAGRVFPAGGLQERGSIAYPYLLSRGAGLAEDIRAALAAAPGPFGRHWLLSEPGPDA